MRELKYGVTGYLSNNSMKFLPNGLKGKTKVNSE